MPSFTLCTKIQKSVNFLPVVFNHFRILFRPCQNKPFISTLFTKTPGGGGARLRLTLLQTRCYILLSALSDSRSAWQQTLMNRQGIEEAIWQLQPRHAYTTILLMGNGSQRWTGRPTRTVIPRTPMNWW